MNDRKQDHNLHIQNIRNLCGRAGVEIDDVRHNIKSGQHNVKLIPGSFDNDKQRMIMQTIANNIAGSTYSPDENCVMTNNCKVSFKQSQNKNEGKMKNFKEYINEAVETFSTILAKDVKVGDNIQFPGMYGSGGSGPSYTEVTKVVKSGQSVTITKENAIGRGTQTKTFQADNKIKKVVYNWKR